MVFGDKIGEFRKWATFSRARWWESWKSGLFSIKAEAPKKGRRAFRRREITLPADSLEEGRMELEEADLQEVDREKSTPLEMEELTFGFLAGDRGTARPSIDDQKRF